MGDEHVGRSRRVSLCTQESTRLTGRIPARLLAARTAGVDEQGPIYLASLALFTTTSNLCWA